MDFDPTSIGAGAGGGFLGVIITFLGFRGRIDRLEKTVDGLPKSYVGAQTHSTCQGATVASLNRIHTRLDSLEGDSKEQTALLYEIKGKLEV